MLADPRAELAKAQAELERLKRLLPPARVGALVERAIIHLQRVTPRPLLDSMTPDERLEVRGQTHRLSCAMAALREATDLLAEVPAPKGLVINLGARLKVAPKTAAEELESVEGLDASGNLLGEEMPGRGA